MVAALIGRVLAWVLDVIANPPLPRRFGAHLRRFVLQLVVLAALCLAPFYLSPHAARIVAAVLVGLALVTAVIAAATFRTLLERFVHGDTLVMLSGRVRVTVPTLARQVRAVEGLGAILRRTGLALPALLFFCGWALIYMLIWAHSPEACSLDLEAVRRRLPGRRAQSHLRRLPLLRNQHGVCQPRSGLRCPQPPGAHRGDDRGADGHRPRHALRRLLRRDRPASRHRARRRPGARAG